MEQPLSLETCFMARKWSRNQPPTHEDVKVVFERLFIPEPNSGCYLWIGTISEEGYGAFRMRPAGIVKTPAHRISWKLYCRPDLPKEVFVLHKCDNRACVNPDHLFEGDQAANVQDMMSKGRHVKSPIGSSGLRGVSWDKDRNKWGAKVVVDGKRVNLGRFTTAEMAYAARQAASYRGE